MSTVDLTTSYMGLTLSSPLISSAGPQSMAVESVQALEEAGVGAVVMYSLFEEQLRNEAARDINLLEDMEDTSAEALSFFPNVIPQDEGVGTRYLKHVTECVEAVKIPVIGSLNGSHLGSWTDYAKQIQDTGVAGLELNIYQVPGTRGATGTDVEDAHVRILEAVKNVVSIPVAVKLSPYFSSTGQVCQRLDDAGADALVMFNRFVQPEIDVERIEMAPGVELSAPFESRLPRTWIAVMYQRVKASLAGTTGLHTGTDLAKYLLSGADVACTTSALLEHGPAYAATILAEFTEWMVRKEFTSVNDVRGLLVGPEEMRTGEFQRAGYMAALERGKQQYGSVV